MGRATPNQLTDLEPLFAELREWPMLEERSKGIFYFKRDSFLHFHSDKSGRRWADLKVDGKWQEVESDFGCSAAVRGKLLKAAKREYDKLLKALKK